MFKTQLAWLLDQINEHESEEFHKNLLADFFKKTYYAPQHFINTKGRNDLVIHNGKEAKSSVGVILEIKKPTNKTEMLRPDQLNVKALHELLLYYLRERISHKNLELRHFIVTNSYEWFIFDAYAFEQAFAQDKNLVKQFTEFEAGRLAGRSTEFFYQEIAAPAIAHSQIELEFVYFDIRAYEPLLRNENGDNELITLFKLFSPEHLLKLPFANDSNSLDRGFYTELLHLIGLTEIESAGKKLIERKPPGERDSGSLLENSIIQLDNLDKIARLDKPQQFGETYQDRLFNIALELAITWINRILFLKLLESQLVTYHQGDARYSFLNIARLKNFGDLNSLFFQVLARKPAERHEEIKQTFAKVPYLNSSLFEPTELEYTCLFINQLQSDKNLPILAATVLKDDTGKQKTGELNTLAYLFEFLNAYDFGSAESSEIQEDNRPLINASVLGLIFEKINGYKDGSFFTPGFITMYMCRETIRPAVIQKFNDIKGWQCRTLDEVYDKIDDRQEANEIINSLKICDPAVGSGHFLVSALNELIAIKQELRILQDRHARRLKEYNIAVVNDELVIFDEDGDLFAYKPQQQESQRLQEALFHEKQTLIENCLFGVDINPNSVKICRLRLWIELLKHAYYKADGELETLPNIDINIKGGNSLVSRFALDADLRRALRNSQWTIDTYKIAVQTYRQAKSREEKRSMEQLIADIKRDFRTEISNNDPKVKQLNKVTNDLYTLVHQQFLFEETAKEKKARAQLQKRLEADINRLSAEIEELKNQPIYDNAFEWRFEFPEVLNNEGDFVGFDVVMGNPPYASMENMEQIQRNYYYSKVDNKARYLTAMHKANLYSIFFEQAISLTANGGCISLITPYSWLSNSSFINLRKIFLTETTINAMLFFPVGVFQDAGIATGITMLNKRPSKNSTASIFDLRTSPIDELANLITLKSNERRIPLQVFRESSDYIFNIGWDKREIPIFEKIEAHLVTLGDIVNIERGCDTANNEKYTGYEKIDHRHPKRLLLGQFFGRFWSHWDGLYLYYEPEKMKADKATARPGEADRFERTEKLIVYRFLDHRKGFICTYDNEQFYCLGSCYVLYPKETVATNMRYLAGILNSKLVAFYNSKLFSGIKVTRTEMLRLPIPTDNIAATNIANVVAQIMVAKQQDPKIDTTALETEIDQCVYKLYGLTAAEIALIELTFCKDLGMGCVPIWGKSFITQEIVG